MYAAVPRTRAGLGERPRRPDARDPEVGDLRAALAVEEDVRRLQVAVDEAALVRVREPGGDLGRRSAASPRRAAAGRREPVLERPAGQVLEHHVGPAVGLAVVVDRQMFGCASAAAARASRSKRARVGVTREHLDCDTAAELLVLREPDGAHAAAAERFSKR